MDLYNIHFKGVVIIDMSFERISFHQSQAFVQVVNVIVTLLLRSYFYACVNQLFSVIIFHISSWKIFPMICSYTNEPPRIREAKLSCHLQSKEFELQISSFIWWQFILVCEAFHFLYSDCAKRTVGVIWKLEERRQINQMQRS